MSVGRFIGPVIAGLLGLTVVVATPAAACACGAFVPSSGNGEIRGEASEVRFDGRAEDIVMQLSVEGESPEAAWILPVPAPARVKLGDSRIFDDLVDLTRPREVVHKRWFPDFGGDSDDGVGAGAGAPTGGVQVLERQTLGPFDVASLAATDAGALGAWLDDNGFALSDELAGGLQPYVDAGWSYVAAKLVPGAGDEALSGNLQPLWVTFPTSELVYPMRLSALAEETGSISLFVLAEHRVARTDRSEDRGRSATTFAAWVDRPDLPAGSALRDLVTGRLFLTRIEGYVVPEAVTDDYRFGYVADDVDVPTVEREELVRVLGLPAGPVLVVLGLLVVGVAVALVARRRRSPAPAS